MATRATITAHIGGKFHTIYTHWDGYPEHMGQKLLDFHNSEEAARAIIALGECSALNDTIDPLPNGWTFDNRPAPGSGPEFSPEFSPEYVEFSRYSIFYGRDRGDEGRQAQVFDTWEQAIKEYGNMYNYLWKDGKWYMNNDNKGNPMELSASLIKRHSQVTT